MPEPILDLAWPLRQVALPDGTVTLATVEQDSDEDVRRGLALICELRVGDLPWAEDIGIPDPMGSTDPAATAELIGAALRAADTRAATVEVTVIPNADGSDRDLHLKIGTA